MNRSLHRLEGNRSFQTGKNVLQSLNLFLTISENENLIAIIQETIAFLRQQIKILMKQRLSRYVKING